MFLSKIDNLFIPTMEDYEEASKQPEIKYHERDFLVTFLQTGYKSKHNKNHHRLHNKFSSNSNSNTNVKKNKVKITNESLESDNDYEKKLSHLRFSTKKDDENFDEDKQKLIYR